MDSKKIIKEQELRDVYYDPSTGYQSAEKLYRKLKENGVKNISRKDVNEWLKYQNTYTRFKPKIKPRKYLKTFAKKTRGSVTIRFSRYAKIRTKKQRKQLDSNRRGNPESLRLRRPKV